MLRKSTRLKANQRQGHHRPLSTREPTHLVFKADKRAYKKGLRSPLGFILCQRILKKYSRRFFVQIEQLAICQDHIHCLVRLSCRSQGQHFFRVVAGQIAQEFQRNGLMKVTGTPPTGLRSNQRRPQGKPLWLYRPFNRVIKGWRPYQVVRSYVRLNEKEACGEMAYKKNRLKELSTAEWELLWT